MTPADSAASCQRASRERACHLHQPGQRLLARGRYPEHVRELSGGDLDADTGQEPDQYRAGQEVRQETEPGDPGEQQHPSGQQSRQPGQPDVLLRSRQGQTGQRGGEDGRGGRIRGHDQVARRTKDAEHCHRQEHGVQAGYQRHPGDLRVAEDLGHAEGGQREAGQRVGGNPGPLHGHHAPQHGQDPQPSTPALADRPGHHLTSVRPPGVRNSFIIPPPAVYFQRPAVSVPRFPVRVGESMPGSVMQNRLRECRPLGPPRAIGAGERPAKGRGKGRCASYVRRGSLHDANFCPRPG